MNPASPSVSPMKRFFDSELETLRSDLFRMGAEVVDLLRRSLQAYAACDAAAAEQIIRGDDVIDQLELRIDEEALRYINLRSPIATELRVIVTGMKASHDLERAADEITKIARRVRSLSKESPLKTSVDIVAMGEIAADMLSQALDCFIAADEARALAVCRRDGEVDRMNRQLFEELTQVMTLRPEAVARAIDLMFVSKAIERVADHATNIAEETIFLFKGKDIRHSPELKHPEPLAQ